MNTRNFTSLEVSERGSQKSVLESTSAPEKENFEQKVHIRNRNWFPRVSVKCIFCGTEHSRLHTRHCQCYIGNQESRKSEKIASAQSAIDQLKSVRSMFAIQSSTTSNVCNSIAENATAVLDASKKNIGLILHDRVPDLASLPSTMEATVAKSTPVIGKLNDAAMKQLAPVSLQNVIQRYNIRRDELVQSELAQLHEATQELNDVLGVLNLPNALEELQGQKLPSSLKDMANFVRNSGGNESIDSQLEDLPNILTRNEQMVTNCNRILRDEKLSDDQLRARFGSKWVRAASESLTENFKTDLRKYRLIIMRFRIADNSLKYRYESVKWGIKLLSLPEEQLTIKVNSHSSIGQCKERLRKLLEVVGEIQHERIVLEKELISKTIDVNSVFTNASDKGNVDEELLLSKVLDETYNPLQVRTTESLAKQKSCLIEIEEVYNEYIKLKSDGVAEREKLMKELETVCDSYEGLKKEISDCKIFYRDLTQRLAAFQSKISDYSFEREAEKRHTLEILTAITAASQYESYPCALKYHEDSEETFSCPPVVRPPLKEKKYAAVLRMGSENQSQSSSLPYPSRSSGKSLPTYPSLVIPPPSIPKIKKELLKPASHFTPNVVVFPAEIQGKHGGCTNYHNGYNKIQSRINSTARSLVESQSPVPTKETLKSTSLLIPSAVIVPSASQGEHGGTVHNNGCNNTPSQIKSTVRTLVVTPHPLPKITKESRKPASHFN
ncbi:hypothetical protein QYM36_017172 [Artemia franciscana]|uniref:Uncharacterized protein n=1 Tax=Artemia franciscana TaxID=6661 RepID=A0AA88KWU5_ARTSF|nr:hypothetical protein QYM36_017172 [Artemia franciscana]